MKKQIKNNLENNLFNLKEYFNNEEINPNLLSNLNSAFELSVRLDQINKIENIIDLKLNYIYQNRINTNFSNGQIQLLKDLKTEIGDGIKKQ